MRQQRYIMSAVLLLLFASLFIGTIIKVPNLTNQKSDAVEINIDPGKQMPTIHVEGKKLYFDKCLSCHGPFSVEDGPRLMLFGLNNRWPDKKELFVFIRNSNDEELNNSENMKRVREMYAQAKFSTRNHNFPELSDIKIQMILDYINWEEKGEN